MKINQLFVKRVDTDVLLDLLKCFGLDDFNDKRLFSRCDLIQHATLLKIELMKPQLEQYYLPCKAKMYLGVINEKRAITILKQVLRLHGYFLISREKNVNNKKIIFYQLINEKDKDKQLNMKQYNITNILCFD
jgi:hypothetical protein